MKKSLVALAALAVVGVASAQSTVALSGKLGFAYTDAQSTGAAPTKSNGLGVTDGDFVIAASEDLGGGLKATASMAVQSRGRNTQIAGRDASITLAGGFGSVTIGAIEIGNGIIGLGGADAPTMGMDGATGLAVTPLVSSLNRPILSDVMNLDVLLYTAPAMGGLTVSAGILDANGAGGMQDTAASQDATLLALAYSAGALSAAADYTSFGLNAVPAATLGADNRLRLSASYDLGVVKLGAGYENLSYTDAAKTKETQYLLGISAPVGKAVTVGANYARNTKDAANTITGYELGVGYALSKRTGVQVAYQSLSEDTVTGNATAFRVRLLHSF